MILKLDSGICHHDTPGKLEQTWQTLDELGTGSTSLYMFEFSGLLWGKGSKIVCSIPAQVWS